MKCRTCGGEATTRRGNCDYSAASGLSLLLIGVTLVDCASCGEGGVRIPRLGQLHRLIAQALIRKRGRLDPSEVRFLRKWLGLSGRDFARRMGVTPETVSRWESLNSESRRHLGGPAERALRLLVAREEPRADFPAELLDSVGETDAPALALTVVASGKGWRKPTAVA